MNELTVDSWQLTGGRRASAATKAWKGGGLLPTVNCELPTEKGGGGMSDARKIALAVVAWVAVITAAHMAANVDWKVLLNERLPESERKLNVAYIPVT
jgi:hypothetical protein